MSLLNLLDDIIMNHILYGNLDMYISLYRVCKRMNTLANKLRKDHYVELNRMELEDGSIHMRYIDKKTEKKVGKRISIDSRKYGVNSVTGKLQHIPPYILYDDTNRNSGVRIIDGKTYRLVDIEVVRELWDKGMFGKNYITYYDDKGNIRKRHILNGRRDLMIAEYDEGRNLLGKTTYNDEGELHGMKFDTYEDNGDKITVKQHYDNGVLHGTHIIWNHSKNILVEDKFYIKGSLI
ncbi:Hypothetical protein ORPV_756 [Orpheovirus IHUMI-LCC2]|uniref:MORN-repeat protein n=1 Tax=Orpheovirus IHUMI-LCC2 TaxID=2023057 RepID=A0A2I2L578_9VIRU|nr:Hypothetical protein ORPV_756 [Orpheovirus IHUMI-LCC2]SNW62660.1 Hypothetical protein ORPV_756 [Orpheovirus IHUMI-LCC2]